MTQAEYATMKNFGPDEGMTIGGKIADEVGSISYDFMDRLDWCVSKAKKEFGEGDGRFIVHCFVRGQHSTTGYHPRGRACDGHFKGLARIETFAVFAIAGFGGIGIYQDGNGPVYWHVDDRQYKNGLYWVRANYIYNYELLTFGGMVLREDVENG